MQAVKKKKCASFQQEEKYLVKYFCLCTCDNPDFFRTRKQHETICQKLTEQKEKRRAEMEKRRIEEVEKQIQKQKQEKIRYAKGQEGGTEH